MTVEPVVRAAGLTVSTDDGAPIVDDVDLSVARGEILGLAGESGSGKSTLARALLGYARPGTRLVSGSVHIAGIEILGLAPSMLRGVRGRSIAYVAQDAAKALNPAIRVGDLVAELRQAHGLGGSADDVAAIFERVNLPATRQFRRRFAHQLSGGQQQRMAIGLAVACDPDVIVLDEPTSGLDVVTQARILAEVARLCRDDERAAIFVSHDLAAMVSIAHRIAVMYAGRIVEERTAAELIASPAHPYTAGLIASVPVHNEARALTGMPGIAAGVRDRPPGCSFAPRCPLRSGACESSLPPLVDLGHQHRVRCIHWDQVTTAPPAAPRATGPSREATEPLLQVEHLRAVHGRGTQSVIAADDVSFTIRPGECLAVVGQSGSGKSTIARCVAGLHQPAAGTIRFGGADVAGLAKDRPATLRRQMQIVFQNPHDSLNPRRTVEDAIARPLALFAGMDAAGRRAEVASLLERVRLSPRLARCFPRELSGGERQRVALARALAPRPQLLICDEVTSSLDVSVQAAVLEVLGDLDVAMLFITHDLGVVASVADSVVVLERGAVRASGSVEQVMGSPEDDYTRALLGAIPELPLPSPTGTR